MSTSVHLPAGRAVPLWVHWLDVLTVLLLTDAAAVAWFGGWRLAYGDLTITVNSSWRLLLAAGVLAAVRHAVHRRPTLVRRARLWLTSPLASPAGAAAWSVCLATRVALLSVGLLAVITLGFPRPPDFRVAAHELANLPARGQAQAYLNVAMRGYGAETPAGPGAAMVFPAVPLLMRLGGAILGASTRDVTDFFQRHHWRMLWAGVVLSIGAFLWALVYVHELAADLVGPEAAFPAVLVLATYPFAVGFGTVGPDSLLLLTSLGAIRHARRREWGTCAAWGLLAALSDPRGVWLSVPIGLAVFQPTGGWTVGARRDQWTPGAWLSIAMPLVGLGVSLAVLGRTAGEGLDWPRGFSIGGGVAALSVIDLTAGLLAAALIVPIGRRLGWGYALLVGGFLGIGLVTEGPHVGRLTAVCFPLHIELAARLSRQSLPAWTTVSSILQGWLAILFYTWRLPV